ncbi:Phage integrase family site specific recombinase [Dirofilaria immitis]|nr:Phage integrase family site specific recombinase [Dirofilaria immitis]
MNFLSTHIGGEANIGSLERLSVPELRSWLSFRYARGVNARNARALSIIRNFLRYIKNNYGVNNEAVFSLSKPIQRRTLPKALSIFDIKTSVKGTKLSNLGEPWVVKREIAIIVLLYGAGLRISEALDLKVGDINSKSLTVIDHSNSVSSFQSHGLPFGIVRYVALHRTT